MLAFQQQCSSLAGWLAALMAACTGASALPLQHAQTPPKPNQPHPQLEALRQQYDSGLSYPDYYLKPFHTYTNGNLEWLAAAEVRPASTVIACRTFKEMTDAAAAEERLRGGITRVMRVRRARLCGRAPTLLFGGRCCPIRMAACLRLLALTSDP